MYKFSDAFDPHVFVGRCLEMICFNANQIYFHFNDKIMICAEASFEFHNASNGDEFELVNVPATHTKILALLEQRISRAEIVSGDTLHLHFDSGSYLRFAPDSQFESYHVWIGEKEVII